MVIRHLRHIAIRQFLVLALHLPARDMRFQTLAEIGGAHACVDDGQDNEDDGEDGKGGERSANGIEDFAVLTGLVHADELEEEVAEAGEVEDLWRICVSVVTTGWWWWGGKVGPYDDGEHARGIFSASEETGHEEDYNGHWDRCNGEVELNVGRVNYHDDELNGKAQEEEEIELEESDVNLVIVSTLASPRFEGPRCRLT